MPPRTIHQSLKDFLDQEESRIPHFVDLVVDDPSAAREIEITARHFVDKVREECRNILPHFISPSSFRRIQKELRELWLEFFRKAAKEKGMYPSEEDFVRALNKARLKEVTEFARAVVQDDNRTSN